MSINFVQEAQDIARLNKWIFDIIFPYITGRTLELGSGSGEIASMFIERHVPIHLTDENNINKERLHKRFEGISFVRAIHDIDFNTPLFQQEYASGAGVFSTIVAVNIAEHGGYNNKMLHNADHFLATKGHFIVITSANAVLFDSESSNFEGLKEYNYKVARNLMGEAFEILKVRYFSWSADREIGYHNESGLYTLAIFRKK